MLSCSIRLPIGSHYGVSLARSFTAEERQYDPSLGPRSGAPRPSADAIGEERHAQGVVVRAVVPQQRLVVAVDEERPGSQVEEGRGGLAGGQRPAGGRP